MKHIVFSTGRRVATVYTGIVLAIGLLTTTPAAPRDADYVNTSAIQSCISDASPEQGSLTNGRFSGGISWAAIADILNYHWMPEQIRNRAFFDAKRIVGHIANLELTDLPDDYHWDYETYRPLFRAPVQQHASYEQAASLYRNGDWADSIPLFDVITSDVASAYRAAAAYSAARAAIKVGRLEDGIHRIKRIIDDPDMVEFRSSAHRLLGTMSYRTGSTPVIAARLSEIAYLLAAPLQLACRDTELKELVSLAIEDFRSIIASGLSDSGYIMISHDASYDALEVMAQKDPMIDLLFTINTPSPFKIDFGWVKALATPPTASDKAATDHARERWLATKNIMWGYALAERTRDVSDIPLIDAMFPAMLTLPDTEAVRLAAPQIYNRLLFHGTRLRLITGDPSAAAMFHSRWSTPLSAYYELTASIYGEDYGFRIIDGGVRYFIEQFDLETARTWAKSMAKAKRVSLSQSVSVLLLDDASTALAERRRGPWERMDIAQTLFPVIDLLPARKLIELGQNQKLDVKLRRKFLSVGWLRLYLLGDWPQAKALLPELRKILPELATDIDNIQSAWFETQQKRLVDHMLLRAPGLTASTDWTRTTKYYSNDSDLFTLDKSDPNDGNWWCSLNIDQLKLNMVKTFFARPLSLPDFNYDRRSAYSVSRDKQLRDQYVKMADKIIAWHPLFREIDFTELEKLSKIEDGPAHLSRSAIDWAANSWWATRIAGRDDLLPEMLHLSVRAARYGCGRNGPPNEFAHSAFKYLHKDYADTEWAKKTPYWY